MSAAKDHFKEPLDKLNQVIEKLEANVGVQEKKEATVEVTTPVTHILILGSREKG